LPKDSVNVLENIATGLNESVEYENGNDDVRGAQSLPSVSGGGLSPTKIDVTMLSKYMACGADAFKDMLIEHELVKGVY